MPLQSMFQALMLRVTGAAQGGRTAKGRCHCDAESKPLEIRSRLATREGIPSKQLIHCCYRVAVYLESRSAFAASVDQSHAD